jgi:ubiquinone/menaquinone biosynthesis C-methylase UbiE
MGLSPLDWHRRFTVQARWTSDLRQYLYPRAGLAHTRRVLEVGCGTGALLEELLRQSEAWVHGLDIDAQRIRLAGSLPSLPGERLCLAQGDAHALPYPDESFDLALCHFLLLWVADPLHALLEMKRVTRPDGAVLALAEPDYGGRIDHPPELSRLGEWQRDALSRQGADPLMGRKLAGLFHAAGLQNVESGVLGGRWQARLSSEEQASEWEMLEADLEGTVSPEELRRLRVLDEQSWRAGERVLFVPVFYAWGRVYSTGTPTSISPSTTRTG